jgi:hypothetical protein
MGSAVATDNWKVNEQKAHPPSAFQLLNRYANWIVAGFSIVYFASMGEIAARKPLWGDEIATSYVGRLPRIIDILHALKFGADLQPPFFDILMHPLSMAGSALALRLPGLVGLWCMSISLYIFISRRLSRVAGMVAMFLPFATAAAPFAYDARPYGIELGGAAAALACWQAYVISARRFALLGMCFFCALVIACHYYGVLILVPFALGELTRARMNRKVDLHAWSALALAMFPLVLALPFIRAARSLGLTFWSRVEIGSLGDTYEFMFGRTALPLAALLVAALIWIAFVNRAPQKTAPLIVNRSVALAEIAAIAGFVLLPLFGVVAGLVTGGFFPRYVIATEVGICAGVAWILGRDRRLAVLSFLALGLLVAVPLLHHAIQPPGFARKSVPAIALQDTRNLPIVFAGQNEFLEVNYYSGPQIAQRLFYLADPSLALRYLGTDAVDRFGLIFRRVAPDLQVADYRAFTATHREFTVISRPTDTFPWLLRQLTADRATVTLRAVADGSSIYDVQMN